MLLHKLLLTGLCAALALPLASGSALAQAFDPGDALVLDLTGNRIIRVRLTDGPDWDPGDQDVVPSGGPVTFPRGLTIASQSDGDLFISGNGEVVRVKAELDQQDHVTAFGQVSRGITFDESEEDLFVAVPAFTSFIVRVDRATGLQEAVSQGLIYPRGIVLDPSDPTKLLVADSQVLGEYGRGVFRVDPETFDPNDAAGNLTPISQHGDFSFPNRLAAIDTDDACGDVDPPLPDDGLLIYVTDPGTGGDPPKVVRVSRNLEDPPDCPYQQEIVASGGYLDRPIGIAIEQNGDLLVADADFGGVIRIHPWEPIATNQDEVSSGGLFDLPWEIHIVPAFDPPVPGDVLVTDTGATPSATGVFRVIPSADPPNPTPEAVSTGDDFSRPTGAAVDHSRPEFPLVVADLVEKAVYQVNRSTGATTPVASGGFLDVEPLPDEELLPVDVVVDAGGDYLVIDPNAGRVIRIDPSGSIATNQEVVSPNEDFESFFKWPMAAAIQDDGRLLVADAGDPEVDDDGRLIEVDPRSGRQICLSQGVLLEEVTDVVRDADGSFVFAVRGAVPVLRLASPGFLIESDSSEYQNPAGLAIDTNRDILVVDAGALETPGDGRILRLDPLESEPTVVSGSAGLSDPFGVAPDAVPETPPEYLEDDQDGDGVSDADDNCVEVPNSDQSNSNPEVDVFGNMCDADFNNDGIIGGPDFILLQIAYLSNDTDPRYDPDIDMNSDGWIAGPDFILFSQQYPRGSLGAGPAGSRAGLDVVGPCTDPDPSP